VRRSLVAGLLLVALLSLGQASWIHLKAGLAQGLLELAWQRARAGAAAPKPWPWADTSPVARLTVPRTGTRLLVLAGASGRTLAFGPAHVAGSGELGRPGNAVVTGHRDTHFGFLRRLRPRDVLRLEDIDGREAEYRVESTAVVRVDELALRADADRPELTLVTCYPFDAVRPGGPWRYVVRAKGVEKERSRA
jgi:sortase A